MNPTTTNTTPAHLTAFAAALDTLTPLEIATVKSVYASSYGNGHDFGYSDDVHVEGAKAHGKGGLLASLVKKGVIEWDSQFGQIGFHKFGDTYDAAALVKAKFNIAY